MTVADLVKRMARRRRKDFSPATILRRLEYCGGRCEGKLEDGSRCPVMVEPGRFRCDHVIPDWMGGSNTFENAQILCIACDRLKTAKDLSDIAKSKRIRLGELRLQKRRSPPIPGSRCTPFKRKVDGTVERR